MNSSIDDSDRFRLVDEQSGTGSLAHGGTDYPNVRYRIRRFQGMTRAGLPVPGVHRIDGQVELGAGADPKALVGDSVQLALEDGRVLRLILVDEDGGVLAEGHGPSRCLCC